MRLFLLIICLPLLSTLPSAGQSCSNRGQTPQSAFPICGTRDLTKLSVPLCAGRVLRLNFCGVVDPNTDYTDRNPFYYKFTCYQTGTLGFTITPKDMGDDYDWHIFDVTGKNVNDIFTDMSMQICGNWSSNPGITGANAGAQEFINCAGPTYPNFSKMPTLQVGHDYLLLVSHFTNTQSGYSLAFGGGTAVITDPNAGDFVSADYQCLNNRVAVKLSKRLSCTSLAANGSDFELLGSAARITGAQGVNCSGAFDMDSVILQLDRPLNSGTYTIRLKRGSDGNTLLDACDSPMPAGERIDLVVPVYPPAPFDSIKPVECRPDRLMVRLKSPVRCNSVAANGSDFVIANLGSGPNVSVVGATVFCNNLLTDSIEVRLSGTIFRESDYRIGLVRGSDGNTLISECRVETPLGQSVSFATSDTVNAGFSYRTSLDCDSDTLFLRHDGAHQVSQWTWQFDDGTSQSAQNASKSFQRGPNGFKDVKLTVANRQCSADHTERITLPIEVVAAFTPGATVLCPLDMVRVTNESRGNIVSYRWSMGVGPGSILRTPTAWRYPMSSREESYSVRLIVTDNFQCQDTVIHVVKTVPSCYVTVPTAFTPNNDGINDFLYPVNGYKTADLLFRVFARNGQLIFESRNWQHKWDGRINGSPASVGTYAWMLEFTNTELNTRIFQKGVTTLLR